MTNKNLLLQDFGLSTFAQDIFKSTLNQEEEHQLQKLILQQRKDKLDLTIESQAKNENVEDEDDDDIPLSKCLFDSTIIANTSRWASQSAPSSRRPSQKIMNHHPPLPLTQQPYSILEDETLHEDDDEDLLPIGVLQDPKAKLLHPCQSAAEKYKNSILCRDPQLKISATQRQRQRRHDQGGSLAHRDRSRRSSFDPASIHHPTTTPSNTFTNNSVFNAHPAAVMRSVSAHHHKRRPNYAKKKPHEHNVAAPTNIPGQQYPIMPAPIQSSSYGEKVGLHE
ncbi:hypothetical protein BCR42DRAFT_497241 [Absidia repens]|uniref:Uncharacterized protein n=1 Tax=Absidia repens TaxID=90262 RepID=A0A1X2HL83_9FUNG|nr:hypothetical protein BCR42DRAFT_497241 [Absidia repens]